MHQTPPVSLKLHRLDDRWRGEVWPARVPHAMDLAFGAVMIAVVTIGLGMLDYLPIQAAYPGAFLALLGAIWSGLRIVRFPVSFEISPSALTIGGDPILWSRIQEVRVSEHTLVVDIRGGEPVALGCDVDAHAAADLAWLLERIHEQQEQL